MATERKAETTWQGDLMSGSGTIHEPRAARSGRSRSRGPRGPRSRAARRAPRSCSRPRMPPASRWRCRTASPRPASRRRSCGRRRRSRSSRGRDHEGRIDGRGARARDRRGRVPRGGRGREGELPGLEGARGGVEITLERADAVRGELRRQRRGRRRPAQAATCRGRRRWLGRTPTGASRIKPLRANLTRRWPRPPSKQLVDELERSYTRRGSASPTRGLQRPPRGGEVGRRLKELEGPYKLAQQWRAGARRPRGGAGRRRSCAEMAAGARGRGSRGSRRS